MTDSWIQIVLYILVILLMLILEKLIIILLTIICISNHQGRFTDGEDNTEKDIELETD